MPQSEFIATVLLAAFLIFVTARGNLGDYLRILV